MGWCRVACVAKSNLAIPSRTNLALHMHRCDRFSGNNPFCKSSVESLPLQRSNQFQAAAKGNHSSYWDHNCRGSRCPLDHQLADVVARSRRSIFTCASKSDVMFKQSATNRTRHALVRLIIRAISPDVAVRSPACFRASTRDLPSFGPLLFTPLSGPAVNSIEDSVYRRRLESW